MKSLESLQNVSVLAEMLYLIVAFVVHNHDKTSHGKCTLTHVMQNISMYMYYNPPCKHVYSVRVVKHCGS